jgi:hypothetical protein
LKYQPAARKLLLLVCNARPRREGQTFVRILQDGLPAAAALAARFAY